METTEKKPVEKNEKGEDKKLDTKATDKKDEKGSNDHGEGSCCGGCG